MAHAKAAVRSRDEAEDLESVLAGGIDLDALNHVNERPLEIGEKAEDAVDYGDIDDDDLAEEEEEEEEEEDGERRSGSFDLSRDGLGVDHTAELADISGIPTEPNASNGLTADSLDDLFGDVPSSPRQETAQASLVTGDVSYDFDGDEVFGKPIGPIHDDPAISTPAQDSFLDQTTQGDDDEDLFGGVFQDALASDEFQQQQQLFARSRAAFGYTDIPPPPENEEEALASMWPKFEKHSVPNFMELMPPKKAHYVGKIPLKPPKPIQPTKVSLEIEADQEKAFKLSAGQQKRAYNPEKDVGMIPILFHDEELDSSNDDEASDHEHDLVGGKTWQDFQAICADFDSIFDSPALERSSQSSPKQGNDDDLFGEAALDDLQGPTAKRRKLNDFGSDIQNILNAPTFECPSFDNFEKLTTKIAKRPILDLNDPHLLLIEQTEHEEKKPKNTLAFRDGRVVSTTNFLRRYNNSNDEAYDKLKQNHQNKVRNTLGSLTINHSLPALRLQWPYYKTKLAKSDARSFHRPLAAFTPRVPITFDSPKHIKRKYIKGKKPEELFNNTSDLSFADNSSVLLLEYSEEYPTMVQNFGMASRLVNYYRKKNVDDAERPRADIGETTVLLPNDTSPLTQFGEINAGEMTPAIFNSMFKAPLYEHQPKTTDFLMVRSTTGVHGSKWYLRNIEHLRVVGQQFPSVEVPPPGGRKVTTASKNRLKMICYRLMKKSTDHRIAVTEVTPHIADSSDMQNRQKMKDFLKFDKENKEWVMPAGAIMPNSQTIRDYVSPEDVCLLESMQVGEQHLEDEGFGNEYLEGQNEDDEVKETGQSVEQQLAPWRTTKNFLNAAANKAMLQVHGEGDPTGRGEAFSFLKVSMKGGFRALGESVEDKIDAKKLKEYGGHNYNVQKQAEQYRDTIHHVWEAQKNSLSTAIEHSDPESDPDDVSDPGRRSISRTDFVSSGLFKRRDDETASHLSKFSTDSQSGRVLKIYRKVRDASGHVREEVQVIEDPRVWKKYVALKNKSKLDSIE